MWLPFGTWSAASSFSLSGTIGCLAGIIVFFPPFSFGAGGALIVALAVGVLLGAAIHAANWFAGATDTALKKTPTKAVAGKVITGAAIAGYVALSAVAVADVAILKAPNAYNDGYESGMSEIQRIENSENNQHENNIQVATPTKKPTKIPTSRPNPTKSKTPQPSYPTLYADQNYQCREGPGKAYSHIVDIYQGTTYRVIGRASNGWYAIAINFSSTNYKYCWIGGGNVSGDLSQVQYYEIQPTLPASSSNNSSSSSMQVWKYIGPHWVGEEISCQKVGSLYWQNTPSSGGATIYSTDINNDGNYDYRVDIVDVQRFCPSIGTSMFHK